MMTTLRTWGRDLQHAARALWRARGFTTVTVITLGLAVGVLVGMFRVVDAVLLKPLPFGEVDRLVHIAGSAPGSDLPEEFPVSSEFYLDYRASPLIEDVSTYNSFTSTMRTEDRVERIRMSFPTYSLFSTLGVSPVLGRLPTPEDELVVVISYALWQTWFGGDAGVIGRAYEIAGQQRTVIGVMGPEFQFPIDGTMLWMSDVIRPEDVRPGQFRSTLVARVAPGVTPEALASELTRIASRFPERYGGNADYARTMARHRAVVRPLTEEVLGAVARPLWVLLGAVAIVLLIACANVANLFAVRAEWRQRDLAVRRAIGAARGQLIQTQMAEAVVVAALAGALAAVLAALTLPSFVAAAPAEIPRIAEVRLNAGTIGLTLAASLVAALVCGLIPALRASAPDMTRLREGGRGATRRRTWGRDGLVAGQTALALVLLIGSSLLVRSFWALRNVDPGYETGNIFTFQIAPEAEHLTDGPSFARFDLEFLDRLAALPGVESTGLVENIPLNESTQILRFRTEGMDPEAEGNILNVTFAAGDYFATMGIDVLQGRALVREDHSIDARNLVISRRAANQLWPGRDPVGQRLMPVAPPGVELEAWYTVVGVVEDVLQNSFREEPEPLVYMPLVGPDARSWVISSPAYVLKTRRAETIAPEVRALVREVAPNAPMYRTFTMAGLARDSMVQLSFTMLTLAIVSSLALILGAVGLYGVLSYVVAQRTREIGVRMALGAKAGQVRWMVVAQGARVVLAGVVVGVTVALLTTRALESLLYSVEAVDRMTFVGMSLSMVLVGMLASYVPARRASRVAPLESLRSD